MVRAFICQIAPDQTSDIKIKTSGSELPQMLDVFTITIIFTIDFTLITIILTRKMRNHVFLELDFIPELQLKPFFCHPSPPKDATQHEVEQ